MENSPAFRHAPGKHEINATTATPGVAEAAKNGAAKPGKRVLLNGIAVSSGIGIGRSQFVNRRGKASIVRTYIAPSAVEEEVARLEENINGLAKEFESAREAASQNSPEQADIIDAYIMICLDPKLLNTSADIIRSRMVNAEWAWDKAVQEVLAGFEAMDSPYLRERALDVQAVATRVAARLRGQNTRLSTSDEPTVMFAHDLTPADTLSLSPDRIIALATEMGGKTSHTGILARSLRLPCVVGVSELEESVRDGDIVVVDAIHGFIIINPDESELARYIELQAHYESYEGRILKTARNLAETEDGVQVHVYGNIELPSESDTLADWGAEGVGLYRTEFGFMGSRELPTEDQLYEDYSRVVKAMAPAKVVLRTLDAGADKMIGFRPKLKEANPAMGLRAIRYCMRHQDIFRCQLRAILRASVHGNAALMFPLISGVPELRQARSILTEVMQELDNEGVPYNRDLPVGTMIELPAAVFLASSLAREVDFFSIGTNDLIQYSLGIDRGNKYVSYLYQPLHPAIIHAIKHVVDMAREAGIGVSVCGEMASDPYCIPLLLGMGITELSITPRAIPAVKSLLRLSDTEKFNALLRRVYTNPNPRSIIRQVRQSVHGRFKDELKFFTSLTANDA